MKSCLGFLLRPNTIVTLLFYIKMCVCVCVCYFFVAFFKALLFFSGLFISERIDLDMNYMSHFRTKKKNSCSTEHEIYPSHKCY